MRKIINSPDEFVDEVVDGILLAHPQQLRAVTEDRRALARTDAPADGRVAIVTGGGSGHLPFFLGYVGQGLCSAVAIGNVFSSPSAEQIAQATLAVAGEAGALYLYGNYGGDVYNFDLAADLVRAHGIEVATVLGTDDIQSAPVASARSRRGVAGLVLVYKLAGAAAERLLPLAEVTRIAQKAADATRTMGVGLSPTILPAAGEPTFTLGEGQMEIGVGIHGEKGTHRGPLESADRITDRFLEELGREIELVEGARVAVLVNGLGATPLEELYLVYRRVHRTLAERGVTIVQRYIGEYVTSLEMAGASLTITLLDEELEQLLLDPASSPFFQPAPASSGIQGVPARAAAERSAAAASAPAGAVPVVSAGSQSALRALLIDTLPGLAAHAEELRELDAELGDGDLGITVAAGGRAAAAALERLPADADAPSILRAAAAAFAAANPSTFAALLGGGVLGAAATLPPGQHLTASSLPVLLRSAFEVIAERGGAALGDKTLLDVLGPIVQAAESGADAQRFRQVAAEAVEAGRELQSRRGRAAWQQERSIGQLDPGSVALQRIIDELTAGL